MPTRAMFRRWLTSPRHTPSGPLATAPLTSEFACKTGVTDPQAIHPRQLPEPTQDGRKTSGRPVPRLAAHARPPPHVSPRRDSPPVCRVARPGSLTALGRKTALSAQDTRYAHWTSTSIQDSSPLTGGEGYPVVKTRDRDASRRRFAARRRAARRTTPDPVSRRSSLSNGDAQENKRRICSSPYTRSPNVWTNSATTTRYPVPHSHKPPPSVVISP